MKKIIFGLLIGSAAVLAADLKMKEVEALISDNSKDVVVIDKKELNKYIKEQKKEPATTDIVTIDMSGAGDSIAGLVGEEQGGAVKAKKEKVIVDGFESFKSALLLENSKQIEIEYKLDLFSGLEVTKYLFANNMQDRYGVVKNILLLEAKKFAEIDYDSFSAACEEMSAALAGEMLTELGALRGK